MEASAAQRCSWSAKRGALSEAQSVVQGASSHIAPNSVEERDEDEVVGAETRGCSESEERGVVNPELGKEEEEECEVREGQDVEKKGEDDGHGEGEGEEEEEEWKVLAVASDDEEEDG